MTEDKKIKYLDILIKNIDCSEIFDIYVVLKQNTDLEHSEVDSISYHLTSFGEKHGVFEHVGKDNKLRLTPKGDKLKIYKKGFVKFEKSLTKKPLTRFEKISIFLIILPIIINLIQWNYSSNLKSELETCNSELDSLKTELYSKKDKQIVNLKESSKDTLNTKTPTQ